MTSSSATRRKSAASNSPSPENHSTVSTERVLRLNAHFQRELNAYLVKEFELPAGCLLTIEEVRVAGDLSHASIFVSVFPTQHTDTVLHTLADQAGTIRRELADRLNLRMTPMLHFRLDEREARAEHINHVLDQAEKEAGTDAKE